MRPFSPATRSPARLTGWRVRVFAALAIVTCPCHLPLLAAVLAGTSVGTLLTEHLAVAAVVSAGVFVLSLVLALRSLHPRRNEQ